MSLPSYLGKIDLNRCNKNVVQVLNANLAGKRSQRQLILHRLILPPDLESTTPCCGYTTILANLQTRTLSSSRAGNDQEGGPSSMEPPDIAETDRQNKDDGNMGSPFAVTIHSHNNSTLNVSMQCLSVLRVIACGRAARPGCARCARHHGALKYEVWARPHYSPTTPTHNMHSESSINRPGTTLSQLNDEVPQAGGPVTDPTYQGRLVSRRQLTTSTKKTKGVTPDEIPSLAKRKQSFATGSDRERLPPGMHPDRFQKLLLRSRQLSVWASKRPGALNAVRRLPRRLRIRLKKVILGRIRPVISPRPFLMYTCNTEQQLAHFFGLPSDDGSSMEVGRHEYLDLQDAEGELGYQERIFSSSSISPSLRAELQHTAEEDLKSGPSAVVMKDVGVPDHAGGLLQCRGRLVMNEGLVLTELSAGTAVTDNIVRSIDYDDSVLLPDELTKNAGRSPPSEPAGPWQVPSGPPSEPAGPWQVPSSPPSEPAGPWQVTAIRFVNHWGRQYGTPILGSRLIRPGLLSSDGDNGSGAQRLVQPDGGIPVMTPWKRCKLRQRAKTSNTEGKGLQLHGNQYNLMSHATAKEWLPLRPLVIITRPK